MNQDRIRRILQKAGEDSIRIALYGNEPLGTLERRRVIAEGQDEPAPACKRGRCTHEQRLDFGPRWQVRQRVAHAQKDLCGRREVRLERQQISLDRAYRQVAGMRLQLAEQYRRRVERHHETTTTRQRDAVRTESGAEVHSDS